MVARSTAKIKSVNLVAELKTAADTSQFLLINKNPEGLQFIHLQMVISDKLEIGLTVE
jgi:hypothetical protein